MHDLRERLMIFAEKKNLSHIYPLMYQECSSLFKLLGDGRSVSYISASSVICAIAISSGSEVITEGIKNIPQSAAF